MDFLVLVKRGLAHMAINKIVLATVVFCAGVLSLNGAEAALVASGDGATHR